MVRIEWYYKFDDPNSTATWVPGHWEPCVVSATFAGTFSSGPTGDYVFDMGDCTVIQSRKKEGEDVEDKPRERYQWDDLVCTKKDLMASMKPDRPVPIMDDRIRIKQFRRPRNVGRR